MIAGKLIRKSALILFLGIAAGTILLTLAYMLPVNLDNREISYQILDSEGWYPRSSVTATAWHEHFHSFYPDVLDDSTDKIMLHTAMDDSQGNPLKRAMNTYSDYWGAYNYYWHGYVSILRPLFLVFDFSELRILNGACQLALLIMLVYFIGRRKGLGHVFVMLTSYMLLSPVTVSMGLQFSWVFYIAMGGTLVMLIKRDFWGQEFRYVYFFLGAGMLTSYFDLLTYPLFTWGIPLTWMLVTDEAVRKAAEWVKCVVISGIGWIAGYAVMWVAKWAIATLVLGTNIFETAINEVFLRSGMLEEGAGGLGVRCKAIYANWKHYGYKVFALILAAWLVWWFIMGIKRGWRRDEKRWAYFLIGVSSIVWYFVLSNHTAGHHFFTYRIFGVSITAFLAMALSSVAHGGGERRRSGRLPGYCLLWGAAAMLSLPLMRAAKEEIFVMNGTEAFQRIPVEESLEVEFVPTYDMVCRFGLGIDRGDAQGGQCEIRLLDGDEVVYVGDLMIKDGENEYYQETEVAWKLKGGRTYRLVVEPETDYAPIYVWVTEEEVVPLTEYGTLAVDGQEAKGQLLTGMYYYDNAGVSREMKLFLMMTWTGILAAAAYAFLPGRICGDD